MNNLIGWTREKLGRSTFKAVLLKPAGETNRLYNVKTPDGKAYFPPKQQPPIKIWNAVKAHYFTPNDKVWKDGKKGTYELHTENVSYQRNEAKLLFIDADSGAPVSFDQVGQVVFTPEALTQTVAAEWVKNAHASVKGMNAGVWIIVGVGVLCLVLGLFVGMSTVGTQINHAIAGNTTTLTTPLPMVIMP